MTCKACGLEHRGWISCAKAKVANMVDNIIPVANAPYPDNLKVANELLGKLVDDLEAESRHGKYADKEKRKAYMRELMRKRRVQTHG